MQMHAKGYRNALSPAIGLANDQPKHIIAF